MKKPDPKFLSRYHVDKLSIELWNEQQRLKEMTEWERAVEDCKEMLLKDSKMEKAEQIKEILLRVVTKRQREIFMAFVDCGNYSESARHLNIRESRVRAVIERVRNLVIRELARANFILL